MKTLVITVTEKDKDVKITFTNKGFNLPDVKKLINELKNLMLLNIK
jgi:hypothetical protein